ncbi:MAG: fasciclin domain-containing protein [Planctomycetota bacterium]
MRRCWFILLSFGCLLIPHAIHSAIGEEIEDQPNKSVLEIIDTYPNRFEEDGLGILSSPLKFCDLGAKLREEESVTLFAPNNKAIRDLGGKRLRDWLIGAGKTYETLQTHIVLSRITLTDVESQASFKSLGNSELTITRKQDDVYVNDSKIVKTIECSNGVVHVIDRVLMQRASLIDTLTESGKYTIFLDSLETAELTETLKSEERFTVFAPTDDAFEMLPYSVAQMLSQPASKAKLADILAYHISHEEILAGQTGDRQDAKMLNGQTVRLRGNERNSELNSDRGLRVDDSKVTVSNTICTNGVLHEIDSVLIPSDRQVEIDEFRRRELGRQKVRYANWLEEKTAQELASLESSLKSQGISVDREGITVFLRQMTDRKTDPIVMRKLVDQLGSKYYAERVAAETSLMELPVIPTDLLREASRSSDFEQSSRAKKILRDTAALQKQTVKEAFRAIELKEISGLTNEVMETVIRFQNDLNVVGAAQRAVTRAATQKDIPALSKQVVPDANPVLRKIAVTALRQLNDPSLGDRFANWAVTDAFDDSLRLECVLGLLNIGDRRALPMLVDLMVDSGSGSVRAHSAVALRQTTGKRFDFYVYATPAARKAKAEAWRTWLDQEGRSSALKFPLRNIDPINNGHTLVSFTNPKGLKRKGGVVIEYDETLKEVWRYDCGYVQSAEKMKNGNVLVAENGRVIEVSREKKIIRQHPVKNLYGARPLPNGHFLVTHRGSDYSKEGGGAFEIDVNGEIVWEVATGGRWNDHAIRLDNGNTLVAEVGQRSNRVIEYSKNGREIWKSGESWSGLEGIQALKNGNVLVTILSTGVIEINKKSNDVVWRFPCEGIRDAHRTANGNTLALTGRRIFEIDSDGVEIWSIDIQTVAGTIRR